jgi:hypothetical protein
MKSKISKLHPSITHPYSVSFTYAISFWNPTSKLYNLLRMNN